MDSIVHSDEPWTSVFLENILSWGRRMMPGKSREKIAHFGAFLAIFQSRLFDVRSKGRSLDVLPHAKSAVTSVSDVCRMQFISRYLHDPHGHSDNVLNYREVISNIG